MEDEDLVTLVYITVKSTKILKCQS